MNKIERKQRIYYLLIISLFIILNIINTYFLTTQVLNRYISPVTRTFRGEITAILGNLSVLLFFMVLGFLIFKKEISRIRYLIVVTIILNLFIFALGFFNLFYGTSFSVNALDIFKNPSSGGVSVGLGTELLKELFIYYRILIFVPFVTLLVLFFLFKKSNKETKIDTVIIRTPKRVLIGFTSFVLLLASSFTLFTLDLNDDKLSINSVVSTKGVQNYGVYPYYLTSFLGVNYEVSPNVQFGKEELKNINDSYDSYNKNQLSYKNIIDGNNYSNLTKVSDSNAKFHDSLNLNNDDYLNGVFKDKNLVLVHLESINHFLFEVPEIKERFKFLNKLFEESYVFDNYYTNVGLGVSADAEATVLTGLDMNGYETFYRAYEKRELVIDTLPKLFNKQGYQTKPIHADKEEFYKRHIAYPELIGFSEDYFSLEDMALRDGYDNLTSYMNDRTKNGYMYNHYKYENGIKLVSPWISEYELADITYEEINKMDDKYMTMSLYMTPHTPFLFNPYTDQTYDNFTKLNGITKKYIEFAKYIDETIEAFFIDPKTGLERDQTNNVYVFYSDHGSSLKNGDIGVLLNKNIPLIEERRMLQQTTAFIYAPSNINTINTGIKQGLIKGNQKLSRGHVDLYRTIGDLFGLFSEEEFYFGVNGLSNEPTFVFDNRIQDLVVDDINNIDKDNYKPFFVSLRNTNKRIKNSFIKNEEEILNEIINYKKLSDLLLVSKDAYKNYKISLQKKD